MSSHSLLWIQATLIGLLWASHVQGFNYTTRICKPAPHWEINGDAPMQQLLGRVVVVALLKAT